MTIFKDSLAYLDSEHREQFLVQLAYWLTIRARGAYIEAGNEPDRAVVGLRCFNELLMVVTKQLLASQGIGGVGYPDEAFIQVLAEKAEIGGCDYGLRWSLEQALQQVALKA